MLFSAVQWSESVVCTHISPCSWTFLPLPPPPIPPIYVITEHQAESPVLYSGFPLVIYFTHGSVYMSILTSQCVPTSPCPAVSTCLFCRSASLFQFIHIVMQTAPLSISRTFASFQIETPYLLNNNFPFFPPPSLATTILLSISMNLTTLGTSYKWYHTIFVLLWLAYFTLHNVFKIHPCCGMC